MAINPATVMMGAEVLGTVTNAYASHQDHKKQMLDTDLNAENTQTDTTHSGNEAMLNMVTRQ